MKLQARDIHHRFGENAVLRGVDLEVAGGEVVALVGENGAGKSTLTRILSGALRPTSGTLSVDGDDVSFSRPQDAMARGISVIYQEFSHNLFPHLSVAENLLMHSEATGLARVVTRPHRTRAAARELLARVGVELDVARPVGRLGVAQQQMVEIAKALGGRTEVLMLDEPTAALDDQESEQLFAQVRRLQADGVGILYISHRLDEVFALADRVVVLRDGVVAHESAIAETTRTEVVAAMVGRQVDDFYPKEHHTRADADPALVVRGLTTRGAFADVDLEVRPGEVLGLAGALGSGRSEVLQTLFGVLPTDAGTVSVAGRQVRTTSPRRAIRAGLAYVVPDRGERGLLPHRSTGDNITLASLAEHGGPAGLVQRGKEHDVVRQAMDDLRVRASGPAQPVGSLSGGNQQKALIARWVLTGPRVLLMDEPTRGVDVGAKTEIYRILNRLTADGVAVVLVSSDLPELVAMSDRALVMRGGRVVAELAGDDLDQQHILTHSLEVEAS
ncbi:sugar ABC transporter ATP-binding protein [Nocardioides mangrovicus]|uniref:Sugar ABC transporter ATP-binding protein n=1 Tax=Nocardioides mangrovicus TaxID=2478913 RepID=A0A3L8P3E3_9ACTN|nr:sugar ABC transporter ATP-binding protein [Nocardioides mangrovicus]RLV49956.1 sugar ABC transporter ATP-binding protein [Nocardioides mangrovicus]